MAVKVAYITSYNKPSGAVSHAQTVMAELGQREGIDLYAVNTKQTGYPETYTHESEHYQWVFPNNMEDTLRELEPDVAIVHTYNTHLFDALRDFGDELEDTAWLYRHGTNMVEQWLSRAQGRRMALSALKSIVWDLDWFDALLAPSRAAADRLDLYYGDDLPDVAVIPNALDLHDIEPTTYANDDTLRFVMATRVAPVNYLPMPLLAFRRLLADHDVALRIFGGGHEALTSSLKRLAGDAKEIEVVGHVDRPAVISSLEKADVALCPTFSQNAMPYSALEGLATGCLTIASRCAAIHEPPASRAVIRCSHEDPTEWYEAMRDACTDTEDAKGYVREGIQASREYDVTRIVSEGYLPVIERYT